MRDGQPKCVCAPKCKTKNQRPKRINRHAIAQLKSHQQTLNESLSSIDTDQMHQFMNQSGQSHRHNQSIHIEINANTSHDIQIFHSDHLNNRSNTKSDKIISIIAPILPSNLSSSHKSKKMQSHHQQTDLTDPVTVNNKKNMLKSTQSSRHLMATTNKSYAQHRQNGKNHRHKLATTKHQYSNSSIFDNNIVNINHRHQTSIEQQLKSKFYGHDIPYPPIDLPVSLLNNTIQNQKKSKIRTRKK